MAVLNARRRYLITAPLALLLPAGLLTYIGLQMVGGVENRHLDQINEFVDGIVHQIRNNSAKKIETLINSSFRPAVHERHEELLPQIPPPPGHSFQINRRLPYASHIFFYLSNNTLVFYRNTANPSPSSSAWRLSNAPSPSFAGWLASDIRYDVEHIEERPVSDTYRIEPYLDRRFIAISDDQRELAAFYPVRGPDCAGREDPGEPVRRPCVLALGFTFDFTYINKVFFQEIIDELWRENALRYPVSVEDRVTQARVAEISDYGYTGRKDSTRYLPRTFSEYFRWYRIHFPQSTGQDIMDIAAMDKLVYYCLIGAADLIMIAGIIGALRNIHRELALSDMRSSFVARVSHELRTPLGLIRLYAETLEMGRSQNPENQKEYLRAITKESERLTHLINNILNFSQIEAQRKQYKLVETPLEDAVRAAADSIHYHMERHGFNVRLEIEPDPPSVPCDPDALQLALYNLLSNAMKYSGESREITVRARREGKEAVIEVADRGIGIPKDQQHKIFQEFYRVDDPQVRETGGSGLGLAVTKHIVEGHRGRLSVESEPGVGSTFRIRLPA